MWLKINVVKATQSCCPHRCRLTLITRLGWSQRKKRTLLITQLIPERSDSLTHIPSREDMDVLRRSSVFAAEVLDVFERSLSEKELVTQSKALCRDYILSRLHQNGMGWSKAEINFSPSNAALSEVTMVLLCLGKMQYIKLIFTETFRVLSM